MKITDIIIEFYQKNVLIKTNINRATAQIGDSVSYNASFDGKHFRLSINNASGEAIKIKKIEARFDYRFKKSDKIFVNGYQSWTDSYERIYTERLHSIDGLPPSVIKRYTFDKYGDYNFVRYSHRFGCFHGFTYSYIRHENEYMFMGSLNERTGFTVFKIDMHRNMISMNKECKGYSFVGQYSVFDTVILKGEEDYVFDEYFKMLNIPPTNKKRINGYSSWYNLYTEITQESIRNDLVGFDKLENKPDVFQIDDGYESHIGDWLIPDEKKFPDGMKIIATEISQRGIIPGLWLAPFAVQKSSVIAKEHEDWLLRYDNGKVILAGDNWGGFYALDFYNSEVQEYLKNVFDTVINEWGYKLLKLDFLYCACLIPRKDKTRAMVMFEAMEFLRKITEGAELLGCGVPLAPAFRNVDYCRIGCDVSRTWDDKPYMKYMHRERISTKNSILNTIFRRQLNGRAFMCDPDVFLLRDDNISLDDAQKRMLATVNGLFGGVLFTSDDVGKYDEEKIKVYNDIQKLGKENVVKIERNKKSVDVVYRIDNEEKTISVPLR